MQNKCFDEVYTTSSQDAWERMLKHQCPVNRPEIDIGDLLLVRGHTSKPFQPRFKTSGQSD